jgi:hypothetical protein
MLGYGAIAAGSIADSPLVGGDLTLALSGLSVATAQGTPLVSTTVAVPGQSAATAQGSLTVVITSGDVTLALTGLSAATAQGTLGLSHAQGITGHSATTSQGTLGVSSGKALTGQASATAQGALGVSRQVAAAGQSASAAQGALGVSRGAALSGHAVAASQGAFGYDVSRGLTGAEAEAVVGIITATTTNPDLNLPLNGHHVHADHGALGVEISYGLSGDAVVAQQGDLSHEREIAAPGTVATVSAGLLYLANEMSLDYVMHGYVDGGYVGATEASVVADMLGKLMAQATYANVYQINSVRVGGLGTELSPWGPSSPPYVGSYASVGGVPSMTSGLIAAVNATALPIAITKVNDVSVEGVGSSEYPWGPT